MWLSVKCSLYDFYNIVCCKETKRTVENYFTYFPTIKHTKEFTESQRP